MKVLWLCNLVLPGFEKEFGIPRSNFGGWMIGMLREMQKYDYEIALCLPIIDDNRMRDGVVNGVRYYSFKFHYLKYEYDEAGKKSTESFCRIIDTFQPNVIHIWGTEYLHTYSMMIAAEKMGIVDRVIIHIQGLISECARHFLEGVSGEFAEMTVEGFDSLALQRKKFERRGEWEKEAIRKAKSILGRTEWDKACTYQINPKANYFSCGEVLREPFYTSKKWETTHRDRENVRIFMTQGSYPIKGVHYALEAVSFLRNKYSSVILEIAGENILDKPVVSPYGQYIERLLDRFSVRDSIRFIGMLNENEVIEHMLRADVYLLSSTIENSPNSLSEAMICGVPVVAAYVGGVGTIIRNDTEGLLYTCNDPNMLAWQVEKIIDGLIDTTELSKSEIQRSMEYNNRKQCVKKLDSVYKLIARL